MYAVLQTVSIVIHGCCMCVSSQVYLDYLHIHQHLHKLKNKVRFTNEGLVMLLVCMCLCVLFVCVCVTYVCVHMHVCHSLTCSLTHSLAHCYKRRRRLTATTWKSSTRDWLGCARECVCCPLARQEKCKFVIKVGLCMGLHVGRKNHCKFSSIVSE